MNPLVHVYFFNPVTGIITYEAMRAPGAPPSNSPRLQHIPGQPKPRSLGKDTRGLIEDLIIRPDHAVYFIATPPSKWEPLSDKERAAKIRRAKIQVRKMELDALDLEAALTQDNDDDDDNDSTTGTGTSSNDISVDRDSSPSAYPDSASASASTTTTSNWAGASVCRANCASRRWMRSTRLYVATTTLSLGLDAPGRGGTTAPGAPVAAFISSGLRTGAGG